MPLLLPLWRVLWRMCPPEHRPTLNAEKSDSEVVTANWPEIEVTVPWVDDADQTDFHATARNLLRGAAGQGLDFNRVTY